MAASGLHLVRRFFGSLFARATTDTDEAWIAQHLTSTELELWRRLSRADKLESIGVARRFISAMDHDGSDDVGDGPYVAAALLHDVGKTDSRLGTLSRVAATVVGRVIGNQRSARWLISTGMKRRFGSYLHHDEIGAALISSVGGRREVAAWAGVHHDPKAWDSCGIAINTCRALATADGETVV